MTMIDEQFERCKAALIRIENLIPQDAIGETTVPIAVHEIDDLAVFFQNAKALIDDLRASVKPSSADVQVEPQKLRKRVRVLVELECNEELFPGWGYNPQDFAEAVAAAGMRTLGSYDPKIITTGWGPVEPRWLADEVARCKKVDVSEARRLIAVGQVDVNSRCIQDPAAQVCEGDMVEVYNSTRQIFTPWRVGE